ncbi:MAG: diguanylate cyclase [Alteromonadaceae bacterium]|nr:diguanylate cyclase [Alteromonadaceae bacterium]
MKIISYLCFFIFFLFNSYSFAKNVYSFKNFAVDNPLSSKLVRTIKQDHNGFMWFGTQEGVHRYDGHQLLNFNHDKNLARSLSSNNTSRIMIHSSGEVWIATRGGGINIYNENTKDFRHISTSTKDISIANDTVNDIIEDHLGNIWIGTQDGLNIIFRNNNNWKVKRIKQEPDNPNSLSSNLVKSILQTASGDIWVGSHSEVISIYDSAGNFIKSINLNIKTGEYTPRKLIKSMYQDKDGNIWIGTFENGLIKYITNSGKMSYYQFDKNDVNSIANNTILALYQDSTGHMMIATERGLMLYEPEKDRFTRINHSITNPYSLTNDYVLTIFEDKNKLIWIGTFSGVSRWDPAITTFSQYHNSRYPELSSSIVMDFDQFNENKIIFSTYSKGIYIYSPEENHLTALKYNYLFENYSVTTILMDKNTLWVGTRTSGLFEINLATEQVKQHNNESLNKHSISANSVTDIMKDRHENIWVSTFYGGFNKIRKDGTFERYDRDTKQEVNTSGSSFISQLLEDNQGYIWLATYGRGIFRFNPETKKIINLRHDANDINSLSDNRAWIMLQDKENNLWIGTEDKGLNLLTYTNMKEENFSFRRFNLENGIKDLSINGLTQDNYGNIWYSSNKGITQFSLNDNKFKNFGLRHGLAVLEYNHAAAYRHKDGTIYFGNSKGFASVNPDNITHQQIAPEIRLTNVFKLNEAMTFKDSLSELTLLTLEYSDQLISFEYVGLDYSAPESTHYKYRLLGFEDEWIDAGKSQRATYTNLPQGTYQLQIIAGNSDNIWSKPYTLEIIVKPAPWQTWWAYLIYTVLIALSLLSYSRVLNKKLIIEQKQKVYLTQQIQNKTKEFQLKNVELKDANKQLENAATVDKLTGVKSRRYLDIYIEQATQLMSQIHQNILPVQRNILPRLYILMVKMTSDEQIMNSQLLNLTDLLLYSRNKDDLVIRWSKDTFAIIGYEKDYNARELSNRLTERFSKVFTDKAKVDISYALFPFNFEKPMELSWDQISVMTEYGLKLVANNDDIKWLGFHSPETHPFNYLNVIRQSELAEVKKLIKTQQG